MKKSNMILIVLFGTLFILPFIVFGVSYLFPKEVKLAGLGNKHRIFIIENPALKINDVYIEYVKNDSIQMNIKINDEKTFKGYTSIYYKGNKNYIPEIKEVDETLLIGKPKEKTQNEPLKLYIKSGMIKKVILNNVEIWDKEEDKESQDEYTYVPSLTEKINTFIKSSVSLQNQMKMAAHHREGEISSNI